MMVKLNGFMRKNGTPANPVKFDYSALKYGKFWIMTPSGWRMAYDVSTKQKQASVEVGDARRLQATSGLSISEFYETFGFVLIPHRTKMAAGHWQDQAKVSEIYSAEIKQLLKEHEIFKDQGVVVDTNGAGAIVRDGTGTDGDIYGSEVHIDFGLTPQEFEDNLVAHGYDGNAWRAAYNRPDVGGFQMINFWRPISPMQGPVYTFPLCLCDKRTVAREDVVPRATKGLTSTKLPDRASHLKHNPRHEWWFYPEMTTDEVLLFKQIEYLKSGPSSGVEGVPHTAFKLPNIPKGAEKRISSEYRVSIWLSNEDGA
ncbi:Hydroxylase/desaturase CTB9 (Cercosporin toxin biosynthesis cluster protein 9), partial [Durusdinium trenchii]